jgi:DNA ligase-1
MRSDANYQRGQDWGGEPVAGCYASRKLNGVCLLWDGAQGWTRSGKRIELPGRIRRTLPPMPLDAEIIAGAGNNEDFAAASAAVRLNRWTPDIHAVVFDAPNTAGDWLERLHAASVCGAPCVSVTVIQDDADLVRLFNGITSQGGEGVMLRRPGKPYRLARTRDLLKVKWSHHVCELMQFNPCAVSAQEAA